MKTQILLTALSLSLLLAEAGQAQLTFDAGVSFATGTQPTGLTTADFNGDGIDDLATTVRAPDRLEVYLGTGSGFVLSQSISFAGDSPSSVVALDADNDGDMDLAVTLSDDLPNAVQLLLNVSGTMSLVGSPVDVGGIKPTHIASGDFDGDGLDDVVTSNEGDDSVSVLRSTGSGFALVSNRSTQEGASHIATGDFDKDGNLDVVVACAGWHAVVVYYNQGGGDLSGPFQQMGSSGVLDSDGVTVGDFDGDGDLDIAGSFSAPPGLSNLHFALAFENLQGIVAGTFIFGGAHHEFTMGDTGAGMASADFNGDGLADMAVANRFSGDLSIFESLGHVPGGLEFGDAALLLPAGLSPDHLVAGDFDGDGVDDLALTNLVSNTISFYINRTPQVQDPFLDWCNGDGGNQMGCTDCPCTNNAVPGTIGGCLNSAGSSARIAASGDPSASLPPGVSTDLRLTLSGAPAGAFCIMLSGSAVAPQNMANMCFGLNTGILSLQHDGLRCAVMVLKRHGGRAADGSGNVMDSAGPSRVWGGEAQPNGGLWKQGGFVAGQTRYFQATYREDPLAGCIRGLNTSQAVEVPFTP